MPSYSVYSVDPDGSISGQRRIDASSDEEAVYAVRSMQRPLETEIWRRDLRIATVPAYSPPGTGS